MHGPWALLRVTLSEWSADEAQRRAAALAYYTIFSIAPLVLIVTALVGLFFGEEVARAVISDQVQSLLGPDRARLLLDMVRRRAAQPASGLLATFIGAVTMLTGAAAVVGEVQSSLAKMWDLPPPGRGWRGKVMPRLFSILMLLAFGALMLASLLLSTGVSAAGKYLQSWNVPETALQSLNAFVSFAVITGAFALLFKSVPRARMRWHDAAMGGALTAVLFTFGNLLLGLYLGKRGPTSVYGAAGSVLAVLLWTYWCAQIIYFGAEFTQVYARSRGWRPP